MEKSADSNLPEPRVLDTETPKEGSTFPAGKAVFARSPRGLFDICVIFFVAFLLVANICATKAIQIGPIVFDGGAILFPLTYVLGDVISEVWGLKAAKRAIVMGFVISVMASLTFWVVGMLPAEASYQNNDAFQSVLGFVPRIVIASMAGYMFGNWLNAYVLVKIKQRWGENNLWVRLVTSTLAGELVDSIIFCTIAFAGIMSFSQLMIYIFLGGYLYKCAVEILCLPLTYAVISRVKKHERYGLDVH